MDKPIAKYVATAFIIITSIIYCYVYFSVNKRLKDEHYDNFTCFAVKIKMLGYYAIFAAVSVIIIDKIF